MHRPFHGDQVWFYPEGLGELREIAIIAHVYNDKFVNICAIDRNGATRSYTSVPYWNGVKTPPNGMYVIHKAARPSSFAPPQPPIDNAHVAEGCEPFDPSTQIGPGEKQPQ